MAKNPFSTSLIGVLLGGALGLAACDTTANTSLPSVDMAIRGSYDVCLARCDALRRCLYQTDVQTTNCRTSCTNNMGSYADDDAELARACKNASEIRVAQRNCYLNAACFSNQLEFETASMDCTLMAANDTCIKP